MKIHELKTDPDVFCDSWYGFKLFEIRLNDRDFNIGDLILLKETKYSGEDMYNGKPLVYTGRALSRMVTCITKGYGLNDGWIVLGVKNV